MKTFVLVMWMIHGNIAMEKIEGYNSLEECQQAGAIFDPSRRSYSGYVCAPGPVVRR